jgi:Leucine-rich repeat (LRR) protein
MALQQLQHLSIGVTMTSLEAAPLLHIAQLPGLTHLGLHYPMFKDAAATAAAWPQLPQLRELVLENEDGGTPAQLADMLANLPTCSSLTKLSIDIEVYADESEDSDDWLEPDERFNIAACASLGTLTGLRELSIHAEGELAPGDVLALSTLTGLSRLVLYNVRSAANDAAATALACCLTHLRHLDLTFNNLGSMTCLVAIAQLTQLTELSLKGNQMTKSGLMQLTALSRLQQLDFDGRK